MPTFDNETMLEACKFNDYLKDKEEMEKSFNQKKSKDYDFIKLYVTDLSKILSLKPAPMKLLIYVLQHVQRNNLIYISSELRDDIQKDLGITRRQSITDFLKDLISAGLVQCTRRNVFMLNPNYFGRDLLYKVKLLQEEYDKMHINIAYKYIKGKEHKRIIETTLKTKPLKVLPKANDKVNNKNYIDKKLLEEVEVDVYMQLEESGYIPTNTNEKLMLDGLATKYIKTSNDLYNRDDYYNYMVGEITKLGFKSLPKTTNVITDVNFKKESIFNKLAKIGYDVNDVMITQLLEAKYTEMHEAGKAQTTILNYLSKQLNTLLQEKAKTNQLIHKTTIEQLTDTSWANGISFDDIDDINI